MVLPFLHIHPCFPDPLASPVFMATHTILTILVGAHGFLYILWYFVTLVFDEVYLYEN